jgi:glycosyltransferase involved in cell wall biosynthesis
LRGTFPSPYEVAPHRLAAVAAALRGGAEWADRIYLHADAVFMRHLLGGRPVVRSFHDFLYQEALLSAFSLPAALTIVPSEYLKRCIEASVGQTGARPLEPVRVIPNGVDVPARRPRARPPKGVAPRVPGDIVLVHPHRPDVRKGIAESLELVRELSRRRPAARVRLLVAKHVDEGVSEEASGHHALAMVMAQKLGVSRSIELFDWMPQARMPSLYAFADATLCIGNFIEAFGLVPLESVAAGTPAVCARAGALRELEGVPGLSFVPHGDIPAAADALEGALAQDRAQAQGALREKFDPERMKAAYVEAITGRLPRPRPGRRATRRCPESLEGHGTGLWRLAPWCHVEGSRIYNDYDYGYAEIPALAAVIRRRGGPGHGFARQAAAKAGVSSKEFDDAVRRGFLTRA